MTVINEKISDIVIKRLNEIYALKEKYVAAWIAETGLKPSESMIVEDLRDWQLRTFSVVKKSDRHKESERQALRPARTLTGKAALLAILEGTHWWTGRYRDGTLSGYFAFLKGRLARKRNTFEAEVLGGPMQYIDDYHVKMLASGDLRWTRGKPVEQQQEKGNE